MFTINNFSPNSSPLRLAKQVLLSTSRPYDTPLSLRDISPIFVSKIRATKAEVLRIRVAEIKEKF